MNSKEKRDKVIKEIIKPLLKEAGYQCSRSTWYSKRDDCYVVIHLQNSQWNRRETGYQFWFNIDVLSIANLETMDEVKNWVNNFSMLQESKFLPKLGILSKYHNAIGYKIDGYKNFAPEDTDIEDFSKEIRNDFSTYILPKLTLIRTMNDWLQMKEDLQLSLDEKEIDLLRFFSLANSLAISEDNMPFIQEHMHAMDLSINEIKDNLILLKEVQRYADYVLENTEEFILKALNR